MPSYHFKNGIIALLVPVIALIGPVPLAFGHGSGGFPVGPPLRGVMVPPDPGTFVNYETPHVYPLDINSSGDTLAVCNTPDNRVEIFSINGGDGTLTHSQSILVGYDPVSCRFRTDTELWVVNLISDSVSVVDLTKGMVIDTLTTYELYNSSLTADEPADVIFTASGLALITGSRTDVIQKYNATTRALIGEVAVDGEDPRGLATNAAATSVYAAVFESGNSSTIIGHLGVSALFDGSNPYSGQNPPFNNGIPGSAWVAEGMSIIPQDFLDSGTGPAPPVPLIVRKDFSDSDKWKDDNGADWTTWISGGSSSLSGRVGGWDLLDNDVAILTSGDSFASTTYATRLMNLCMAIGVNPSGGNVFVVGTDATNEVRFEPNITGTFTRVMLGITNAAGTTQALVDLNEEHLDTAQGGMGLAYSDHTVTQTDRDKSIGDPRGIAFKPSSTVAYISGMGSDNVVGVSTSTGERISAGHSINVGAGPTGIKHHGTLNTMYVLNKFDNSITVIGTTTTGSETIVETVSFFDPTPDFINLGRPHLYNTHQNSGLGQISCASCHIDSRMDRLSWDLGNPAGGTPLGTEKPIDTSSLITGLMGTNPAGVHNFIFGDENTAGGRFHTMKGPMTTQTLQDIIGHEPHHWRGDRDGLEEFAGAFVGLQGRDSNLDSVSMMQFEDFLGTIHFGPNPFRPLDNALPGGPKLVGAGNHPDLPIPGHLSPGPSPKNVPPSVAPFSAAGTQLPDGDAFQGFIDYVDNNMDSSAIQCSTCHALPMGSGPATNFSNGNFGAEVAVPLGPNGEAHLGLVDNDGTGQPHMKVAQIRNQMDKEGFFLNQVSTARAGFGVLHDGQVDGTARFLASAVFQTFSDQDLADIVAFTLCVNGGGYSDLFGLSGGPSGTSPDGGPENTAHAAAGRQVTVTSATPNAGDRAIIDLLVELAHNDKIGLVVSGRVSSTIKTWYHVTGNGDDNTTMFQPDAVGGQESLTTLLGTASTTDPLTFTGVPAIAEVRIGVDRDEDSSFNGVENAQNTDPANPDDVLFADAAFGDTSDGTAAKPHTSAALLFTQLSPSPGKKSIATFQAGNYNQSVTVNKRVTVKAVGGTVVIGAP